MDFERPADFEYLIDLTDQAGSEDPIGFAVAIGPTRKDFEKNPTGSECPIDFGSCFQWIDFEAPIVPLIVDFADLTN